MACIKIWPYLCQFIEVTTHATHRNFHDSCCYGKPHTHSFTIQTVILTVSTRTDRRETRDVHIDIRVTVEVQLHIACRLCITECKTWCRLRWSREKRICRSGGRGKPGVGRSSVQWKTPRSKFGSRQALKPIGRVSKSRVRECLLAFSRLL